MSHVVALVRARKTILLLASLVTAVGLALLGAVQPAGAEEPSVEEGKILFSGIDIQNGAFELQTMNPDGSGVSSFSPPVSNAGYPEWSADGTKFVYLDQDTNQIVVASADGAQRTTVPVPNNLGHGLAYPTLSPDGTKVAFTTDTRVDFFCDPETGLCGSVDASDIYTMNVDGSNLTQLDSDAPPEALFADLDWSPDGNKIALTHYETHIIVVCDGDPCLPEIRVVHPNPEIYTVDANGTGQPTGLANPVSGAHPAWSPDGSEIVFTNDRDLYIMNADGTGQRSITTNDGEFVRVGSPAWSPKGTRIAFTGVFELPTGCCAAAIYTIDLDGSNQTNLTSALGYPASQPSWQPVFPDTTAPKVTSVDPDGTKVVARDSTVTAEFSEEVQEAKQPSQTLQLFSGKSTKPIKATLNVQLTADERTSVTLTPSSKLDAKTRYTAKIKGGIDGVKDQVGNQLVGNTPSGDYEWSFTTGAR